jgi:hypothetical protein
MNATPHLNRQRVRDCALEIAKTTRFNGFGLPRFNRISLSFLKRIDRMAVEAIQHEVRKHPSIGKTLK